MALVLTEAKQAFSCATVAKQDAAKKYPNAMLAYLTVNVASGLVRLSVYVDQLTAGYAGVSFAAQLERENIQQYFSP